MFVRRAVTGVQARVHRRQVSVNATMAEPARGITIQVRMRDGREARWPVTACLVTQGVGFRDAADIVMEPWGCVCVQMSEGRVRVG